MSYRLFTAAAVFALLLGGGTAIVRAHHEPAAEGYADAGPPTEEDAAAVKGKDLLAVFETSKGKITLELYSNDSPLTVANFKNLADAEFYDGLTFHRVKPDFMVQGGDPEGTGMGGPGYSIRDEESAMKLKHDSAGILSMAKRPAPHTAGSQFFITHNATPWLDGKHAVFGKVVEGMDVVNAIRKGDVMTTVRVVEAAAE